MSLWKKKINLADLNKFTGQFMTYHLGIEIIEVGDDYVCGTMPVDHRTLQPHGILHGGASCVLAETLGSIASNISLDQTMEYAVGLSLTANHIRSVSSGKVTGVARPLHLGRSTHVWEIRLSQEEGKLVCVSQLTTLIKQRSGLS